MKKRERARMMRDGIKAWFRDDFEFKVNLWGIVRPEITSPTGGCYCIVFGLGNSAASAWHNAIVVMHGERMAIQSRPEMIAELRRQGWRARKLTVLRR